MGKSSLNSTNKVKFVAHFCPMKSQHPTLFVVKTKRPRNARPLVFYLSEEISREVLRQISLRLKLR